MYKMNYGVAFFVLLTLFGCDTASHRPPSSDQYRNNNVSSDEGCTDRLQRVKKPSSTSCVQGSGCDDYVVDMKNYESTIAKIHDECRRKYSPTISAPIPEGKN